MMQVTEAYFWKQVKAGLGSPGTHLCRVENTAGSGIPDLNACRHGIEVWVELKVFHGNRLYFRNSQRSWAASRIASGGRTFVVARRNNYIFVYRGADIIASESSPYKEGSFWISDEHLPPPVASSAKPFRWDMLGEAIFSDAGE